MKNLAGSKRIVSPCTVSGSHHGGTAMILACKITHIAGQRCAGKNTSETCVDLDQLRARNTAISQNRFPTRIAGGPIGKQRPTDIHRPRGFRLHKTRIIGNTFIRRDQAPHRLPLRRGMSKTCRIARALAKRIVPGKQKRLRHAQCRNRDPRQDIARPVAQKPFQFHPGRRR